MICHYKKTAKRGQALVESALVLVCFVGFLVGAMDFAQVLFFHQALVERVRAGLRWGSVHAYNETSIKNVILYSQTTAGSQAFLGLTSSNVSISRIDSGQTAERLQIAIVDFPYVFVSPWIARTFTNNLAVVETLPVEYKP